MTNDSNKIKVTELVERAEGVTYVEPLYFEREVIDWTTGKEAYCEPLEGGNQVSWSAVCGSSKTGMFGSVTHVDPTDEKYQALFRVPGAGRGDYNQRGITERCNMEYLLEHYPDTFITIGYSSHDGMALALPMTAEIPEELADALTNLLSYTEPLDVDRQSRLEEEVEDEDWESWLKRDFESAVEKALAERHSLDIYEVDMSEYLEAALTKRGLGIRGLFDAACEKTETYPVFETSESCHIPDLESTVASKAVDILDGEDD